MESDNAPSLVEAIHRLITVARMVAVVNAERSDEADLVAAVGRRLTEAVAAYDDAREFAASWAALHGGRPKLTVVMEAVE